MYKCYLLLLAIIHLRKLQSQMNPTIYLLCACSKPPRRAGETCTLGRLGTKINSWYSQLHLGFQHYAAGPSVSLATSFFHFMLLLFPTLVILFKLLTSHSQWMISMLLRKYNTWASELPASIFIHPPSSVSIQLL